MYKETIFNDILDACLERLARGEAPEQCLASYPDEAAELEPLLRTAAAARQAANLSPRAEARAKGWQQVSETLRKTRPVRPAIFAMPRWAIAVAVLAIFFVVSGAVVGAAASSLPDSSLYPVKLATERAQLTITFSKLDKTELLVRLADRRVSEITAMAESGKPDKMTAPAKRLDELLVAVAGPVSTQPTLIQSFSSAPEPSPSGETVPTIASLNETALDLIAPVAPPAPQATIPPSLTESLPETGVRITSERVENLPPEQAELVALLRRYQAKNPQQLQAVLSKATPETRVLLESIISRYQTDYQQAIDTWQKPLS